MGYIEFAVLCIVSLLAGFFGHQLILVLQKHHREEKINHAKCIAHIAAVTSNRMVASAFRNAAAQYDSVDERVVLDQLAREKFHQDSHSIPALWMLHQAELLDPTNGGD